MRKPFREEEIFNAMHKHLGVRYVYEDTGDEDSGVTKQEEKNALSVEAIAALDRELVGNLQLALIQGDLDLAASIVEKISGNNPALAKAIETQVDKFDFDKILTLIDESKILDN